MGHTAIRGMFAFCNFKSLPKGLVTQKSTNIFLIAKHQATPFFFLGMSLFQNDFGRGNILKLAA